MWLWTISTNAERGMMNDELGAEDEEGGEETRNGKGKAAGFALEYDAGTSGCRKGPTRWAGCSAGG
jgi:hypothetical protein